MVSAFNKKYAEYYDAIYSDKDYKLECDFLEIIFRKHSSTPIHRVLDVGCGTGGHLIQLAQRGYGIVGIDVSEPMVNIAQKKIEKQSLTAKTCVMDVRKLSLNETFDVVICMFAVMNYLTENDDLIKTFANLREHLKLGGLLIFDFWYGPAVLNIMPSAKFKHTKERCIEIFRFITPEIDVFASMITSHYKLIVIEKGRVIKFCEDHVLRYFFAQELFSYLKVARFKILEFCEFMKLGTLPTENTWNAVVIAKAVS